VAEDAPLIAKYAYRVPQEVLTSESLLPRSLTLHLIEEEDSHDHLFDPMGRTPSESEYSSRMSGDTFEGRLIELHELRGELCSCALCKDM
jgi:hypothetical protein